MKDQPMQKFITIDGNIIRIESITAVRPLPAADPRLKPSIAIDVAVSQEQSICVIAHFETADDRDKAAEEIRATLLTD